MRINEPGRFVQGLPGFDCIRAVVERLPILAYKNLQKTGQIFPPAYDISTAAIQLQDTYIKLIEGVSGKNGCT